MCNAGILTAQKWLKPLYFSQTAFFYGFHIAFTAIRINEEWFGIYWVLGMFWMVLDSPQRRSNNISTCGVHLYRETEDYFNYSQRVFHCVINPMYPNYQVFDLYTILLTLHSLAL